MKKEAIKVTKAIGTVVIALLISTPLVAQNQQIGRIKGTLTYYFNANSGDKADVGSEIWLIPGRVEIPESPNEADVWDLFAKHSDLAVKKDKGMPSEVTTKYKVVRYSVADGNGNFELLDVPIGQYTLVIRSNHSKTPESIGKGFSMPVTKIKVFAVELAGGAIFDASTDFGASIQ